MKCSKCKDFSKLFKNCKRGYINPQDRNTAIEIGFYSSTERLCPRNKWRSDVKEAINKKVSEV